MIHRSGHATWNGIGLPNANVSYDGESFGGSKRTHSRFASSFLMAALMTVVAPSHCLCDSAFIKAMRMPGRTSTSSCPRRRRARVIHTPCASASPRYPAARAPRLQYRTTAACAKEGLRGSGPSESQATTASENAGGCG